MSDMKAPHHKTWLCASLAAVALASFGCERGETRSRTIETRTENPGSINEPKNTGDTRAKTLENGHSPSASPTGLSRDVTTDRTPPKASGPGIDPDGDSGQQEARRTRQ